jgi:hypothetical protein
VYKPVIEKKKSVSFISKLNSGVTNFWLKNTYTLNFNDVHGVVVNGEDKHGQRGHVDETNTVGLSRYKVEGRVGVVVDQTGFYR